MTAEIETNPLSQDNRTAESKVLQAIEDYVGRPLWPIEEENLMRELKRIADTD